MDATGGADERGRGASSTAMDAKQATMRIIAIMEGFGGRLDDVMADPRARAELDAIFPGVQDREFRALLESCMERSQVRHSLPPPSLSFLVCNKDGQMISGCVWFRRVGPCRQWKAHK